MAVAKTPRKKRYVERPDMRQMLLDAAEHIFREEGYAAATARRIASRAGLKHQVVFYYFGSQDELLRSLFQRTADSHLKRLKEALSSKSPIRALWMLNSDPDSTKLSLEFLALANHNDTIRAEIAKNAEKVRALEAKAVERHLKERGIEPRLSPALVSILTTALARLLVQEATLGIHGGHEEADNLVANSLTYFEAYGGANSEVEPVMDAMSHSN